MFDARLIIMGVLALVGLTAIAWRKGWRLFSLVPMLGLFLISLIQHNIRKYPDPSQDAQTNQLLGMIYFLVMIVLGLFGPKKPIISKNQQKIAELEKKIEELEKTKEE